MQKAAVFLWSKQGADGGWHSVDHGILRGGQAYSPFILLALMQVPDSIHPVPKKQLNQGLNYIRTHVNANGTLGLFDPDVMEYPNYSTAYALRVLVKAKLEKDEDLIAKMKRYLIHEQFVEDRGFTENKYEFGGWGFGETNMKPGESEQVDLSHTRRVLQALRESGVKDEIVFNSALKFLAPLQKHPDDIRPQPGDSAHWKGKVPFDGGFYYSPIQLVMNKAGRDRGHDSIRPHFFSYGSATADGLLSLLAAGLTPDSPKVQQAMNWLIRHDSWDKNPGIREDNPENWEQVMVLYHASSRAEALSAMNTSGKWKFDLFRFLKTQQSSNGSFSNPEGAINKEDDPLLGTGLALNALLAGMKQSQ